MGKKKKIGFIGFGNLGRTIAKGINEKMFEDYEIVGIYDNYLDTKDEEIKVYTNIISKDFNDLLSKKPDIIIEAATGEALKEYGSKALESGADLIVLSSGAFADLEFKDSIDQLSNKLGRKVYIVSGAIGGFDIMEAMAFYGDVNASITTEKSPASLKGAPYLENREINKDIRENIFSGNTKDAIKAFPQNVNVAVAMGLATNSKDPQVNIISEPQAKGNIHTMEIENDLARVEIKVTARASSNMRSSSLAAYSVLAKLKNLASGISKC